MGNISKLILADYIKENYGEDYVDVIWSDKNELSAHDYAPKSKKKAWFKCPAGIHEDQYRQICNATIRGYKCRQCSIIEQHKRQLYDLTGKKFGMVTVLEIDRDRMNSNDFKATYWKCKCDCGKEFSTYARNLTQGLTKSCGCNRPRGENNPNWKGGLTPEYLQLRRGDKYTCWRNSIFVYDNYTCQCCGKKNTKLNAHHIKCFALNKDIIYDFENGITLCDECHSLSYKNSLHRVYGTYDVTPEQLEKYINDKRKELGITIPFNINRYIKSKENTIKEFSDNSA